MLNISDIPVFGVLTHADQIEEDDTDFPEFEKKFKTSLGLTAMRYLLCSSYCDEISRENGRNPNVEVPVMRFLRQVRQFIIFNLCTILYPNVCTLLPSSLMCLKLVNVIFILILMHFKLDFDS